MKVAAPANNLIGSFGSRFGLALSGDERFHQAGYSLSRDFTSFPEAIEFQRAFDTPHVTHQVILRYEFDLGQRVFYLPGILYGKEVCSDQCHFPGDLPLSECMDHASHDIEMRDNTLSAA